MQLGSNLLRILKSLVSKQRQSTRMPIPDWELEYLLWICSLYVRIRGVPGHIAEVGVADGRNTVLFARLIRQFKDDSVRQYIGIDTFDGFNARDLEENPHLSPSVWKDNSRHLVLERCRANDVADLVEIFEGDVTQILDHILTNHRGLKFQKAHAKFALVYIDCNAYAPALFSMERFLPFMVPGGVIAIDEKQQGGETAALMDFAAKNGLVVERLVGGNQVPMAISIPDNFHSS